MFLPRHLAGGPDGPDGPNGRIPVAVLDGHVSRHGFDYRLKRLGELAGLVESMENENDRAVMKETVETVIRLVTSGGDLFAGSNFDNEVLHRFIFSQLRSLEKTSDVGEYLADDDVMSETCDSLETKLGSMEGSSFVEKADWLSSLFSDEDAIESIVADANGGLL